MRSNWRESRRLRSRRLFCNARKPEICWVVYQEYATTAARVTISPRKSPAVGDRTVERCTPRDYNVSMERRAPTPVGRSRRGRRLVCPADRSEASGIIATGVEVEPKMD